MSDIVNGLIEQNSNIIKYIIVVLFVIVLILLYWISRQNKKVKTIKKKAEDSVELAHRNARSEIDSMRTKFENEKIELSDKHTKELNALRLDCANQIKQMKEKIEDRKEVISRMSEKEVLVSVMLALDGYASRLNRIEDSLADERISNRLTPLFQQLSNTVEQDSDFLASRIDNLSNYIQHVFNNSPVLQRINDIESELQDMSSVISEIESEIQDISSSISGVESSISDGFGCNCSSDIQEVKEDVSSIKYAINDISSNEYDHVGYDAFASQVESLQSTVDEFANAVESLRDSWQSYNEN